MQILLVHFLDGSAGIFHPFEFQEGKRVLPIFVFLDIEVLDTAVDFEHGFQIDLQLFLRQLWGQVGDEKLRVGLESPLFWISLAHPKANLNILQS